MKKICFGIIAIFPLFGAEIDDADRYFLQKDYAKAVVFYEQSDLEDKAVLEKLGRAYLELAREKSQEQYFIKAEQTYQKLGLKMALARVYFIWGSDFAIEKGLALIEGMEESDYLTLLLGSISKDYTARKNLYLKILSNSSSPFYAKTWKLYGLNELEMGHFSEAAEAFDKASDCQKLKAEAYARQNTREGYLKALSELQNIPGISSEVYYLKGLVAAKLYQDGVGEPFGEIAEKSLKLALSMDQKPETMKTLGILYLYQDKTDEAARVFEKLIKNFPTSVQAEEAHLWLSKEYLKKLYTDYPSSKFADEAYFRYYPFESYLSDDKEAAAHLYGLSVKYPESNYCGIANYILGQKSKQQGDLESALDFFEKSDSKIERAHILLELDRTAEAEKILVTCHDNEEAAYLLVKIYIKERNIDAAEHIIDLMLKKNKFEGYYISRFWYERGIITLEDNKPKEALEYFVRSEESAKDKLNADELLELWIQQSHCHRLLGDLDNSMMILSRVANYNAISSLRIKAMYLRAEIYEMQGRHELARKQLQATSTKGGEWALKAKQKMEKDYVSHSNNG